MNFNKTTSYSLIILSFMANNENNKMSASYLHDKLGIPYSYLRQVLGYLSKNGFIRSNVGRGGGFGFTKKTSSIYLADIIDVTEGLESINKCVMGFESCSFNDPCAMHDLWSKTRNEILDVLKKTSLRDLAIKRKS